MSTHQPQKGQHAHGYHSSFSKELEQRTAEENVAFLLPHLKSGDRLLDVGSGRGMTTIALAQTVAPGGTVGVEIEESQVEIARQNAGDAGVANIRFMAGTAHELEFEDESFDVVFMHYVLEHIDRPQDTLAEARRVLRPGGIIAVRHGDRGAYDVLYPEAPAIQLLHSRFMQPLRDSGVDARFGPRQERELRAAGFSDMKTRVAADPRGHMADVYAEMLENRAPRFVSEGIFSEEEFGDDKFMSGIVEGIREWSKHPDAIWILTVSWETIGWK
ncbi:MAG: methyltransferase domain-containing protein [Dehalococcoidia bacterium]